jgi:hypothetical protein
MPRSASGRAQATRSPRSGKSRDGVPPAAAHLAPSPPGPVFAFVEFLREIPLTATNKPDRKALTAMAEENARGRRRAT